MGTEAVEAGKLGPDDTLNVILYAEAMLSLALGTVAITLPSANWDFQ
jgi:hypothetical protein